MPANRTQSHFAQLAKDFFTYGTMSALSRLASLLLLPILTRSLSVEEYGTLDLFSTFVAFLATAIRLALPSALSRFVMDGRDEVAQTRLYSTLLMFALFGGVVLVFLVTPALPWFAGVLFGTSNKVHFLYYGCGFAYLTAIGALPKMMLRMHRRIVVFSAVEIGETVTYFILAVMLVTSFGWGVEGVFLAQLVAGALSLLLGTVATRRHLSVSPDFPALRRSLRFSLPLVPSTLSTQVYAQTNRIVLVAALGLAGVGVFGAASRIASVLQFGMLAFRMVWQPYSLGLIQDPRRDEVYRRTLRYFVGAACICGLALVCVSPEVFQLAVPPEYAIGAKIMPWLLGASILHEAASITVLGLVLAERTVLLSAVSVMVLPLNLGLSWWLISVYGLEAAAVGTFAAEGVFMGSFWILSTRHSTIRFDSWRVCGAILSYVVVAAAMVAVGTQENEADSFPHRLAMFALGAIVIAALTADRAVLGLATSVLRSRRRAAREES